MRDEGTESRLALMAMQVGRRAMRPRTARRDLRRQRTERVGEVTRDAFRRRDNAMPRERRPGP